jgi:hypothetical protein
MSVTAVSSDQTQTLSSLLLQQVMANGSGSQDTSGATGALGDLLTLSPGAQQLAQAPDAVVQAMQDLFSGQKDTQGDLAQLKGYFQKHPQSLVSLLGSLQGSIGTYSTSSSSSSKSALLTALMNGQSNGSDPSALLSLLSGSQGQGNLFDFMGNSGSGSNGSALSIFG